MKLTHKIAKIENMNPLYLTYEEVKELPKKLLQELSLSDVDKTEHTINAIIEDCGGVVNLDRLLVELYKRTNEIYKRTTLISKLYRMANKKLIYNVPNKKGFYSNYELNEEKKR